MFQKWRFYVILEGFDKLYLRDYTGKLVKSIVYTCSAAARRIISSREEEVVKSVAISPLYKLVEGGKPRALYPGAPSPNAKPEIPVLPGDSLVWFEVGVASTAATVIDELIECLNDGAVLRNYWGVDRIVVRGEKAVLYYRFSLGEPLVRLRDGESVKLTFAAPTLPVNPWKSSRWKRLLPVPEYLFAVNARSLYGDDYVSALVTVSKVLSPAPTVMRTAFIRYYYYSGSLLPALVGYAKFYIDMEDVGEAEARIAEEVLSHAAVMGVGSGRAAGFGNVWVETGSENTGATF